MSGDRDEIERIKKEMRRERRLADTARLLGQWLGSPQDRETARRELEAEGSATPPGKAPPGRPTKGIRRKPGRRGWSDATFWAAYREARDRAGGDVAPDKAIAAEFPMSLQQFQRLVRRHGRPD